MTIGDINDIVSIHAHVKKWPSVEIMPDKKTMAGYVEKYKSEEEYHCQQTRENNENS